MNYAAIKKHDIANGPGVRVSLFVSGCTHHCDGCFNPETWDFHYGSGQLGPWEITQEVLSYLDVLVDGEFHQKEKDLTLRFRGSRNQRVIDVKKSLAEDQIIWWDDEFGVGAPH